MPTTPITPCLWFDHELEQAVEFYTSVFPDSEVHHVTRSPGCRASRTG